MVVARLRIQYPHYLITQHPTVFSGTDYLQHTAVRGCPDMQNLIAAVAASTHPHVLVIACDPLQFGKCMADAQALKTTLKARH